MSSLKVGWSAAGLTFLVLVGSSISYEARRSPTHLTLHPGFRHGFTSRDAARFVGPRAALSSQPGDQSWSDRFGRPGFDGIVHALADYGGNLIAGGDFMLSGGTIVAHVAQWNGQAWEPLDSGLGPSCSGWRAVEAFTLHNQDLIAGGSFTLAGNDTVNGLARWNGASWGGVGGGVWNAPSQTGECGRVHAVLSFEGQLVVGGAFDHVGDMQINNLARWDGARWTRMGNGFMGEVRALTIYEGTLLAASNFYNDGQTIIQGVLQWDGNDWLPLGPGPESYVSDLVQYRGDLIAAGNFERAGDVPAACIARWDGSLWSPLGSGITGDQWTTFVNALGVYDDKLFVGGEFTHAGGIPASSIAIWDGAVWSTAGAGLQTGFLDEEVNALHPFNGSMVAGGNFARSGDTQADFVASWNGSVWSGLGAEGLGLDGIAFNSGQHDGALVVVGSFEQTGHIPSRYLARWNGATWEAMETGFLPESTSVVAVTSSGGDLYVSANHFGSYTDTTGSRVYRWDGYSWAPIGPKIDRYINCLALYGGDLFAAGRFSHAGETPVNNIVRWDGTEWQALGLGVAGEYGEIRDLLVFRDELVAAGTFTSAGGNPAANIARWNGQSWHPLGAGLTGVIYANVWDLVEYEGNLVAVGEFESAGGLPAAAVAMWDGYQWSALDEGIPGEWGLSGSVACAAATGRHLFVGGWFDRAGQGLASNIAHWDGNSWSAMGAGLNEVPFTMTLFKNELCVGGWFTSAGSKKSAYFATWSDPAVAIEVSDLEAVSTADGVRISWRLAAEVLGETQGVSVERALAEAGPFSKCSQQVLEPLENMQFMDTDVRPGLEYWYRIALERNDGSRTTTRAVAVHFMAAATSRTRLEAASGIDGAVHIRYSVGPELGPASLGVYDARGRRVWSKTLAVQASGTYTEIWDRLGEGGVRTKRGIYFVKLNVGGRSYSTRLVLLRP